MSTDDHDGAIDEAFLLAEKSSLDEIRTLRPVPSNHRLESGCKQTSVEIGKLRRRQFGQFTSRRQTKPVDNVEKTPSHLRGDDRENRRVMRDLFDHTKLPMKPPGK